MAPWVTAKMVEASSRESRQVSAILTVTVIHVIYHMRFYQEAILQLAKVGENKFCADCFKAVSI